MRSPLLVENRLARTALGLSAALVLLPATRSRADQAWDVSQAELRVVCPMTVGGSFEAKTTSLTGVVGLADPRGSRLSGSLSADLRSLDTGIGLRNDHMRAEYLEVGKGAGYDKAVLSDIHLGGGDLSRPDDRTRFTATLLLHGVSRPVSGQAEIRREGSEVRVEARFPLELPDYGIPKPRYLGVGVRDQVEVKVSLVATPAPTTAGSQ